MAAAQAGKPPGEPSTGGKPVVRRVHALSRTVLTVDDSSAMREVLYLVLTAAGFGVAQAEDGVHGLGVLGGEVPDVIITDINMPRMNGFGFIEAVRRNPRYSGVPILVLSSENDPEKKARARTAGAAGWIVKPFTPAKLLDAVDRVSLGLSPSLAQAATAELDIPARRARLRTPAPAGAPAAAG
jgi:two-component system chemotaxis response regulator CheY